jgi:hypothetical protein
MLKRTTGYFLLTLLVLTGLAGRMHSDTLTGKERKHLVNYLKESKSTYLKSIKGLSEAQLNFKPSPDKWSVKECMQHIAITENELWSMADAQLKKDANPEKKSEIKITDEMMVKMMTDRSKKFQTSENMKPIHSQWKTADEAEDAFKEKRNALIRYAKTSTDDMRNHVAQLPFGYADCYQMILFIAAHTLRHTAQIEEVKSDPNFPR